MSYIIKILILIIKNNILIFPIEIIWKKILIIKYYYFLCIYIYNKYFIILKFKYKLLILVFYFFEKLI